MTTLFLTREATELLQLPARFDVDSESVDQLENFVCFTFEGQSWGIPAHMIAGLARPLASGESK